MTSRRLLVAVFFGLLVLGSPSAWAQKLVPAYQVQVYVTNTPHMGSTYTTLQQVVESYIEPTVGRADDITDSFSTNAGNTQLTLSKSLQVDGSISSPGTTTLNTLSVTGDISKVHGAYVRDRGVTTVIGGANIEIGEPAATNDVGQGDRIHIGAAGTTVYIPGASQFAVKDGDNSNTLFQVYDVDSSSAAQFHRGIIITGDISKVHGAYVRDRGVTTVIGGANIEIGEPAATNDVGQGDRIHIGAAGTTVYIPGASQFAVKDGDNSNTLFQVYDIADTADCAMFHRGIIITGDLSTVHGLYVRDRGVTTVLGGPNVEIGDSAATNNVPQGSRIHTGASGTTVYIDGSDQFMVKDANNSNTLFQVYEALGGSVATVAGGLVVSGTNFLYYGNNTNWVGVTADINHHYIVRSSNAVITVITNTWVP